MHVQTTNYIPTATAGVDYGPVYVNVLFSAGTSSGATQCVNISITDDSAVEEDETFTVFLYILSRGHGAVTLENAVTNITITNG